MKVTNSKGEVYKFSKEEMELMLMWAYGYMDLARTGYLPVDLGTENDMQINNFKRKLEQCLDGEYEITEKTIKGWLNEIKRKH